MAALGAVYGPCTGRCISDRREIDIEHIVALSEAHDSGLCAADAPRLRLRPAAPDAGRTGGEPQPEEAPRFRAVDAVDEPLLARARVVEVRRMYTLTVDAREANALERMLSACVSTKMIVRSCETGQSDAAPKAPTRHCRNQTPAGGKVFVVLSKTSRVRDYGACRHLEIVGRQRERTEYVTRGAASRHRPGVTRPSGLPVHARWRQRR